MQKDSDFDKHKQLLWETASSSVRNEEQISSTTSCKFLASTSYRSHSGFHKDGGFRAMQYHDTVCVHTDSDRHGLIQMASHELLRQVKQESPAFNDWFSTQASNYIRAGAEAHYGRRIAATGADVDGIDMRDEILADFTGDGLADPQLLETLATNNPTKFGQVLRVVTGSSPSRKNCPRLVLVHHRYFDEVDALRGHCAGIHARVLARLPPIEA